MKFAEFIRDKRKAAGLSQDTVAEALGYAHRANVSRIEAGKLELKVSSLVKFAQLLGVTVSALFEEYEAMK